MINSKAPLPFGETDVDLNPEHKKNDETVGEFLKRVRNICGYTIEDVANDTRINLRYLDAIEHDDFSKLPGETFLNGFLRSYARFLNIDENEIVGKLKEVKRTDPQSLNRYSVEGYNKDNRRGIQLSPKNIKIVITFAGGLFFILILVLLFGSGRNTSTIRNSQNVHEIKTVPEEIKPDNAVASSSEPVVLKVSATELTWMQAIVDGKEHQEKLLKPGEEVSWTGEEKITLTVGNAGGVDLEVNGKKLEPLGKRGVVVRNIVITSAGVISGSGTP